MCPRNFLPQALAALLRSSTSAPSSVAVAFSTHSSHLSKRHNNFKLGYRKYSPLDTDIIVDTTENNSNIINRPCLEEIEPCKSFDSFGDILPISNHQEKKNTSFDTTSKSTQEGTIWSSPTEKKKNNEKVVEEYNELQYDTVINLFDFEENTDAFAAGISSLTWFEGDANSAVEVIRPRIKEILTANPWLLGSLRGSSPMRLEYNANIEPTTSDVDRVFQFFSLQDTSSLPDLSGKLKYGMDLTEMNKVTQLYDLVLEPSKHLVNTNKPLFKISLVPESSEFKRFALVVSLSHRIADGATFYNLYQMIDPTSEIHAIDPTRKLDVLESIDNLTGKNKDEKGITGTYFKLLFVRDKMRSFLRKSIGLSEGPTFQQRTFLLDKDYINQVKAQHDPFECEFNCPFISTNDVITSTCFNIAKPDKVDKHFGTMSINFKGKVPNLEKDDAPNYIHVVIYGESGELCILCLNLYMYLYLLICKSN